MIDVLRWGPISGSASPRASASSRSPDARALPGSPCGQRSGLRSRRPSIVVLRGIRARFFQGRDRKAPNDDEEIAARGLKIFQGLAYSGGKSILNEHRRQMRPLFPQTLEVRVLPFLCLLIHPDVAVDLAHVALPHHSDGL